MSVSTMRKLTVFAPKGQEDALIRRLMRLRCVQVQQVDGEGVQLERASCDAQRAAAERRLDAVTDALEILAKYSSRKGFVQTRNQLDIETFMAERYEAATYAVEQTLATKQRQGECFAEIQTLQGRMHALAPWLTYSLPLGLEATSSCEITLGVLPAKTKIKDIRAALDEYCAEVESVFSDDDGEYVAVVCHKHDTQSVQRVLAERGFLKIALKEFSALPREEYDACGKRVCELQTELDLIEQTLFELATKQDDLEALWDVENSALTAALTKQKLAETGYCVVLQGWAPLSRVDKITETLQDRECAFELEEPEEGDAPPVLLRNNKFAQNFEWVVGMYSYPKYGTYDPTMIMSIFYLICFGLMFADVGYGLLLTLGGFLIPPIIKMKDGLRRSFNMFGYCGIACVVGGVIFGGWFGDMPYSLMVMLNIAENAEQAAAMAPFFNGLQLTVLGNPVALNPLNDPLTFLIVAVGFGAIHLIAGMIVKFVLLCKDKQVFAAIFDVGSWLIIFSGLGVAASGMVLLPKIASMAAAAETVKMAGIIAIGVGVLMIVCTAGRSAKNPIMKFFKGLLGLYDAINYAADLLSYSRILALGLASAVIAQVINMVGTMFLDGPWGFLIFLPVALLGHAVNMALNVLGSFVHTSRLQYLEFFGKFFEDGGEAFVPVADSDRYTEQ